MVTEWSVQHELEKIVNSSSEPAQSPQRGFWARLRQVFSVWAFQTDEPQIYEETDPETGKPYWRVYNPSRDQWVELDTREAVLQWLEKYPYF